MAFAADITCLFSNELPDYSLDVFSWKDSEFSKPLTNRKNIESGVKTFLKPSSFEAHQIKKMKT